MYLHILILNSTVATFLEIVCQGTVLEEDGEYRAVERVRVEYGGSITAAMRNNVGLRFSTLKSGVNRIPASTWVSMLIAIMLRKTRRTHLN